MSTAVRVQIEVDPATQDLWRLAETDDTGLLEQTLARGADINASNSEGVTALMKAAYNGRVGLALLCPITSRVKGYPFEVALPAGSAVLGVVLADQAKSLDWRVRKASRIGTVPAEVTAQVLQRLQTLLSDSA